MSVQSVSRSFPLRPLLAVLLAIGVLGFVFLYVNFQAGIQRASAVVLPDRATGQFDVEVTLTFDADADPFSINQGESLVVSLVGQDLLRREGFVPGGKPIVLTNVQGVTVGANEFVIQANPQAKKATEDAVADPFNSFSTPEEPAGATAPAEQFAYAVRVRILRDDQEVGDQTLWSAPGEPVVGVVRIVLKEVAPADSAEPDHE